MNKLPETQEGMLKFIDFWGTTAKESLLKSGFTKQDLTTLKESDYIKISWPNWPLTSYSGEKMVYLKQKGIDYLSTLLKEEE